MSFTSHDSSWVLQGPFADRPSPTAPGMEPGVSYYATDTDVLYEVVGTVWKAVSGAGSLPIPATQIVFGTGPGVTSDPHFVWNSAFAALDVYDMAGIPLFSTDGTGAGRSATFRDAANVAMETFVSTADASRAIRQFDENGDAVVAASLWTATRLWGVYFASGVIAMRADTRPATAGVMFSDLAGLPVLTVDEVPATRKVLLGAPAQFQSVSVLALPPVVDGQQVWVADGHKAIDPPGPPGTGTGVMAYGSLLPAPAWRVFSTDLPVV